jgi:transcriptional regulator with XRE-family HTH domain
MKLKTVTAEGIIEIANRFLAAEEITQAEFARRIGISRSNLADMLAGRRSPWPIAQFFEYNLKTFSKEI